MDTNFNITNYDLHFLQQKLDFAVADFFLHARLTSLSEDMRYSGRHSNV